MLFSKKKLKKNPIFLPKKYICFEMDKFVTLLWYARPHGVPWKDIPVFFLQWLVYGPSSETTLPWKKKISIHNLSYV